MPEFRQTGEEELELVRTLMRESFHAPDDRPSLQRSLLQWKYHAAGPSWPGSRSYVLAEKRKFVAHAAIWPLQIRMESGLRTGIGFCDWAASEEFKGIGLLLLKKLTTLAPFVLVIGGADITRQILPRVGFAPWAELPVYARVLRPLRQAAGRPTRDWKEPARLARNQLWSLSPCAPPESWTAEAALPDEKTLDLAHQKTGSVNTREFLAFMLQCPSVPFRSLLLRKAGVPLGYAMTVVAGGQGRITELRIASDEPGDWAAAVSVVVKDLKDGKAAHEVICLAPVPHLEVALAANGFRVRDRTPLVILDSERKMKEEPVPQLGMLVDDSSYNYFPEFRYVT